MAADDKRAAGRAAAAGIEAATGWRPALVGAELEVAVMLG